MNREDLPPSPHQGLQIALSRLNALSFHKPDTKVAKTEENTQAEEKMDAKLKIFTILMLFCLCKRGAHGEQCSLSDLHVEQTTLQQQAGGYQNYAVEVNNTCICTQTDVKLLCPGFNSSISVDPSVISPDPDGNLCTLVNRGPVTNDNVVKFYYAWSTQFSFAPVSSNVACS